MFRFRPGAFGYLRFLPPADAMSCRARAADGNAGSRSSNGMPRGEVAALIAIFFHIHLYNEFYLQRIAALHILINKY
jgi:hypothetical protein